MIVLVEYDAGVRDAQEARWLGVVYKGQEMIKIEMLLLLPDKKHHSLKLQKHLNNHSLSPLEERDN